MSMMIVNPRNGARNTIGAPFPINIIQQMLEGAEGSVIAGQFSNHEEGPWETCRAPGGGGEIEVASQPWDARDESVTLAGAVQHAPVWFRAAVFQDQGLTGPPVHTTPAVRWGTKKAATQPAK